MSDNRYTTNIDEKNSLFSKQQQQQKDEDGNGSQGRRVYLESPSFDTKEEEDMYRYVPSRLTDGTGSIIDTVQPKSMDPLDFEFDLLTTNHRRPNIPRQVPNLPRSDPRQDPLLGPLLAELDAMSNQPLPSTFLPYSSNPVQTTGLSTTNHGLTNFANRTVSDALLDSELYDTYEPKIQTNMNAPSSSFLNYFGQEDQLFQRPLRHTLGQNYLPNTRPPLQLPKDTTSYVPPRQQFNDQPVSPQRPNPFIDYQRAQQEEKQPNQETFFTDHPEDQDSKRQAVWNELQRTSAKTQEKNAKKQESPARNRAPFGSTLTWNDSNSRRSSDNHHPPPPITRSNYADENVDANRNKENSYHRSPVRKYENTYAKQQEPRVPYQPPARQTSIPVTVNLNPGEHSQSGSLPTTVTVPVDSQVNRVGDKISVNIDLRLVDLDNAQQQQQTNSHSQWSSGDPLDLHIRKLERNIEQTLPVTSPRQRNPVLPSTAVNPLFGRYANKQPSAPGRAGYVPPSYGVEFYNPNDRNRDEDSYLAKLNQNKRSPHFKPYTGRDYEQFKKNYGFGTGHLGYDFDNTTHKEKLDKIAKTRQYAQQIEARNRKKISEASRRTLSDTRLPKPTRVNDVYDM